MLRRYQSLRGEVPRGTVDPKAAEQAVADAGDAVAAETFRSKETHSIARQLFARVEFDRLMLNLMSEDKRRQA